MTRTTCVLNQLRNVNCAVARLIVVQIELGQSLSRPEIASWFGVVLQRYCFLLGSFGRASAHDGRIASWRIVHVMLRTMLDDERDCARNY